jgi:hypothetical protein
MWRFAMVLGVSLSLLPGPIAWAAEAPTTDPEVIKGIKLVDDGDFDAAILTLDNAARRLAADPSKARELSSAYLYLGIAYMGKGHEAAAKAKFREALTQIKDITLSPDKYPPKVIDAFEAARSESKAAAPTAARVPEKKKGGSKGILIGVGVLAAAGVGVGVAAGGGGGSDSPSTPAPPPRRTDTFNGTLNTDEIGRTFTIVVGAAGNVDATATWTDSASVLALHLLDSSFNQVGPSANRTGNTTLTLGPQPVVAGTYNLEIEYDTCNGAEVQSAGAPFRKAARPECTTNFTASATHP